MSSAVLTPLNKDLKKSVIRDSNIELLRLFAIFGVMILHYNGYFALSLVTPNSINQYILVLLEGLFICAVNVFVLISGYFSVSTQKRKAVKALELVIQVICMNIACYLLTALFSGSFTIAGLLNSAVPNNYYAILYITVYLVSPYINIVINRLTDKQLTIFTVLLFVLFSVWPTILDILQGYGLIYGGLYTTNSSGSQYGYSFINFALMYIIGAFLRKKSYNFNFYALLTAFVVCLGILFVWQFKQPQVARAYSNPLVIALAVIIFLLFKKINFKSKFINSLSKATFTCFLIHGIFLGKIGIANFVNASPILLVAHMLVSAVGIFLVSWVVWVIYDFVTRPVFKFIGSKLTCLDNVLSPENT
ncbi:MAG: acyltransferase [Clostridia bacterium]|nr:acyltransferase [Clostridia bacterium]